MILLEALYTWTSSFLLYARYEHYLMGGSPE